MATRTHTRKTSKTLRSSAASIAAIKRQRTARLASLATRAYYLHYRGQDEHMYDLIGKEFMALGGVYIKFLQGILLQSPMMKRWQSPDRLKIFENLDHEPLDIGAVLRRELTSQQLANITQVQPQPFAAGSFGQVYYGQLANGKPVVIKVLRPMVRELLRYDLRLLGVFSKSLVNKLSQHVDIDLDTAVKEFRVATLRETDYVAEATFAREMFESYRGHATFTIPETFLELSTPHLIVQEYIEGISVAQLLRMKDQGVDPVSYVREYLGSDLDAQLQTLGVETVASLFSLPRVQGDPHPGNVRLLPSNKIGLIDFGISARTPENKAAFFGLLQEWSQLYQNNSNLSNLFEQFMRFFVNDLYRALKKLSEVATKNGDTANNYTREVGKVAQEMFTKTTGVEDVRPMLENGRILQIISQMVNKDNRFGLVLRLESSEFLRAAQTYMTLVEALDRRSVVMPKVFAEIVGRVTETHPEIAHQGDASMGVAEALEVVSKWLERVAGRDQALFRQIVGRIKLNGVHQKVASPGIVPETEKADA